MAMAKKNIERMLAVAQLARKLSAVTIELKEVDRQVKLMHQRYDRDEMALNLAVCQIKLLKKVNKNGFNYDPAILAVNQRELVLLRKVVNQYSQGLTRRQAHSRFYSQRHTLKKRLMQAYAECDAMNVNPDKLLEVYRMPIS